MYYIKTVANVQRVSSAEVFAQTGRPSFSLVYMVNTSSVEERLLAAVKAYHYPIGRM